MADPLSRSERSERMSRIRAKDSSPELQVRRLLHRLGYRYRLHDRKLAGCPDIVFRSRKAVIFVHGCFWHRHPDPGCKLSRLPKTRLDFWLPKLEGNRARDSRVQSELEQFGWRSLIVWECELRHEEQLKNKLVSFLHQGDAA